MSRALVSRSLLPGEEDEHIARCRVHVQLQYGGYRGLDIVGLGLGGVHELHRVGAPQHLHRRRAAKVAAEDLVGVTLRVRVTPRVRVRVRARARARARVGVRDRVRVGVRDRVGVGVRVGVGLAAAEDLEIESG